VNTSCVSLLQFVPFSTLGDRHLEICRVNFTIILYFLLFSRFCCLIWFNADDFNIEDKSWVRWNFAHLTISICVWGWTDKCCFASSSETDKTFIPTANHTFFANLKAHWRSSFVAWVKHFTVQESSRVVNIHGVKMFQCLSFTLLSNLDREFGRVNFRFSWGCGLSLELSCLISFNLFSSLLSGDSLLFLRFFRNLLFCKFGLRFLLLFFLKFHLSLLLS